ncbi:hypothetical protein RGR602_PC02190 (plasmid) [Rhizobium gallicum bv. gallicum R602sp]|uniref:Uncharacterized protein n=1 Tax=Rhizobium gallicum bv. gallicum R602sp TaxID=1041138 RepID=A0A0B4XHH5_9HYPH|nr:hypothetical protein RGR602_PC02190 [Rhizobium gallicum bv. gallicum R602sp]
MSSDANFRSQRRVRTRATSCSRRNVRARQMRSASLEAIFAKELTGSRAHRAEMSVLSGPSDGVLDHDLFILTAV